MLELPRAPGHDGIRAPGHQSLTAASKATIVLGGPGAGPTCFAVTLCASCRSRGLANGYAALGMPSKGWPWVQTAHTNRASLLATATATLL